MEIESWLAQLKNDEPELSNFITKIEVFVSEVGFNGAEFERKVGLGVQKAARGVDDLFNRTSDAENQ